MPARILIVEDDTTFRSLLRTILAGEGYEVLEAADGRRGRDLLRREQFDLVISDLKLPGKSGLELFRESREETFAPPFILLTAFGTVEEAVAAIKEGVVDFLTKPLKDPETLRALVRKALDNSSARRENQALKEAEASGLPPEELIFAGEAMAEVCRLVKDVAGTTATVMINGESGTGKELIARALHLLSSRKKGSFIPLNCAAIPENLLESELFGHERGAFTGAVQARQGKFELAQGGTIFLDEIGEMPMLLQAKLLRVIQERTFERVGGSREIKADVRIVAATHRDLAVEVQEKRFREDLFYRLNVFPLRLPPLRERRDALPLLAEYFIRRFSRDMGKKPARIEPEALKRLKDHDWPGNIRELQNALERAVIIAGGSISVAHLPEGVASGPQGRLDEGLLKSKEREAIMLVLRKSGGNRRKAAEELGISRRTLQYRLKEYGLIDGDEGEEQ
jgi:DNA-binding NtrC family response regulator